MKLEEGMIGFIAQRSALMKQQRKSGMVISIYYPYVLPWDVKSEPIEEEQDFVRRVI